MEFYQVLFCVYEVWAALAYEAHVSFTFVVVVVASVFDILLVPV